MSQIETRPTPDPKGRAPRGRRWPKVLLAVSLTFNLLVLGLIAGAHFREGRDGRIAPLPPERTMFREGGFAPFFDAMPRDMRRGMAEAMRARDATLGPDREALVADFRDFLTALRGEPFDPDALDAVLTAQHTRFSDRVAIGRSVLVEQISKMSPEERAAFATTLEERFRGALDRGPKPGMRDKDH